jgi:all-trans-retinol dehydrogenase (NAD+)
VLISGGSSGLGLLMAKDFAKRGTTVVIMYINPPKTTLRQLLFIAF